MIVKRSKPNKCVRDALERHRLNQYELGEALGMSESTIYRLLRNELPEEEQAALVKKIEEVSER